MFNRKATEIRKRSMNNLADSRDVERLQKMLALEMKTNQLWREFLIKKFNLSFDDVDNIISADHADLLQSHYEDMIK